MKVCAVKKQLGYKYILYRDIYCEKDYWIGIKSHSIGWENHSVRTCCPAADGIFWTEFVIRIEHDSITIGSGDGYHRSFADGHRFVYENLCTLKDWLDCNVTTL